VQSQQVEVLRSLLTDRRVLSLAVLVDDQPVIGLLPFAVTSDYRALIVHASRLARHTRGLADGAPFDALVHELDTDDVDPMQVKRATFRGTVKAASEDEALHGEARAAYLAKFPSAEPITTLGDFAFFRLEIAGGRIVTGFGAAANITADVLQGLGS
jgi:hypothetical protein